MAAVGMNDCVSAGSERSLVPWYPAKKNSLFLTIGPPTVPPYWFLFNELCVVEKYWRALKRSLRKNSNTSPWNSLVPDFVTAVTADELPRFADNPPVSTLNSCVASGNGRSSP